MDKTIKLLLFTAVVAGSVQAYFGEELVGAVGESVSVVKEHVWDNNKKVYAGGLTTAGVVAAVYMLQRHVNSLIARRAEAVTRSGADSVEVQKLTRRIALEGQIVKYGVFAALGVGTVAAVGATSNGLRWYRNADNPDVQKERVKNAVEAKLGDFKEESDLKKFLEDVEGVEGKVEWVEGSTGEESARAELVGSDEEDYTYFACKVGIGEGLFNWLAYFVGGEVKVPEGEE